MKFLLAGILSVVGAGRLLAASTNLYINDSTVTYTDPIPPIDATAFVNLSDVTLSIYSTGNPFEITSLQHLTNYGTMAGFPGFLFRYRTNSSAVTKPMSSFENNGIIASQIDLQVNATNILNNGLLLSGDRGYISLQSSFAQTNTNSVITNYTGTINLAGSGLQTGGNPLLESAHTGRSFSGRYTNDLSVFDLYWGAGVNDRLTGGPTIDPRTLAASFRTPVSPSHEVTQIVGVQTATNLFYSLPNCGGTNYSAYQQTSILGVGNTGSRTSVVQVVFVNTNAFYTNVQVQVGFVTSNYFGGGGGWTSIVQFAVSDTSIVDQSPVTSYLYLLDSSLMTSNLNSYDTNQLLSATWRPSNYRLTRGVPSEWLATFPAVPTVEPLQNTEFFYFPLTSTHPRINVAYSAYSAWLGQTNFPWNAAPAVSDPTNYPGKVEIFANQLNTADTRIRSDNYLGITARNVAGQPVSKLPQIDAPFINMDIGTTNPVLLISNTFPSAATVVRLHGQVSAYSAVWSILTTNIAPTTGTNFATNYFSTQYHVLLVDNCLTPQPVNLNKFVAHAKHLDIQDPLTLKASMLLDVQSLNLGPQADLTLPPGWGWGSTNVQGLRSLTNWANLTIPAQANFWDTNFYVVYTNIVVGGHTNVVSVSTNQFDDPYLNFVNHGGITATKIEVRTGYFENSATPNAAAVILSLNGVITLKTLTSQIRDGGILANNKLSLFASELDITNSVLWAGTNSVSGGGLEIAVTNRLSDGGPGANNEWHTSQGIQMDRLPLNGGDLLGTTLYSVPTPVSVTHTWPGRDLGRATAGYTNNLALARLVLDGSAGKKFRFQGLEIDSTNQYALYVDYLDLRNGAMDFNSAIQFLGTNFIIYFANASVPPKLINEASAGHRLRWVYDYAGALSSTNITIVQTNSYHGVVTNTYTFNIALASNPDLNSDRDDRNNAQDPDPLFTSGDVDLVVSPVPGGVPPSRRYELTWWALAYATNSVEYATNLIAPQWMTLTNFVNGPDTTRVSITNETGGNFRIYRVRENPYDLIGFPPVP